MVGGTDILNFEIMLKKVIIFNKPIASSSFFFYFSSKQLLPNFKPRETKSVREVRIVLQGNGTSISSFLLFYVVQNINFNGHGTYIFILATFQTSECVLQNNEMCAINTLSNLSETIY